jgi:hypothetical protein
MYTSGNCGELITCPRSPSAWSRNLIMRQPRPCNGLLCHCIIIIIIIIIIITLLVICHVECWRYLVSTNIAVAETSKNLQYSMWLTPESWSYTYFIQSVKLQNAFKLTCFVTTNARNTQWKRSCETSPFLVSEARCGPHSSLCRLSFGTVFINRPKWQHLKLISTVWQILCFKLSIYLTFKLNIT